MKTKTDYSLETVGAALKRSIRRAFETIDLSDEDERLDVLRRFYAFTTVLVAEEAHAWGVVDPLGECEEDVGMLSESCPELQSAPPSRSANSQQEIAMRTTQQTNGTEPEPHETNVRGNALLTVGHALALSVQQRNPAPDSCDEGDSFAILEAIRLVFESARNELRHSHFQTEVLAELFEAAMALGASHPGLSSELIRVEAANRRRADSNDRGAPF